MSFALTEAQLLDGSKTVTRRLGWKSLKAGDKIQAVKKAMGLRPGEKIQPLGILQVVDIRREPLEAITQEDVFAEGFPGKTPDHFIMMFCGHMDCTPKTVVTRIEFLNPHRKDPS